jgi:hypothetical protein
LSFLLNEVIYKFDIILWIFQWIHEYIFVLFVIPSFPFFDAYLMYIWLVYELRYIKKFPKLILFMHLLQIISLLTFININQLKSIFHFRCDKSLKTTNLNWFIIFIFDEKDETEFSKFDINIHEQMKYMKMRTLNIQNYL